MNIVKMGLNAESGRPEAGELEAIRALARRELGEEEVYTFSLILCDNDIDRDYERFEDETLQELSGLFAGKTGISDHQWKSGGQCARIFRCEFIREQEKKTCDGRDYACIKARAYMLRTAENSALIADIEGGIKREVSVGCAVAETVCSICGKALGSADCGHVKGQRYEGKLCCGILRGAVDAYEWSFVAVPAQRRAGVVKAFDGQESISCDELAQLRRDAALGREYLAGLRAEVKRLGLICDRAVYKNMDAAIGRMEAAELKAMEKALRSRAAEKLPLFTQLPGLQEVTRFDGSEYRI